MLQLWVCGSSTCSILSVGWVSLCVDVAAVGVWFEYVQYSIGGMAQPGGMQCVREVFEAAITACGLHFTRGAAIWEAYREFENAVLAGLQVWNVVNGRSRK